MAPETDIHTARQQVRIRTKHGSIRIGPEGRIHGLWRVAAKELRTNEQVRKLAGGITRKTLLAWRKQGFPKPVMTIPIGGPTGKLELWERTAVEDWLETNKPKA